MEQLLVLYIVHHIAEDECSGLFKASVLEDGSDDSLEGVGYHRIPLPSAGRVLSFSEQEIVLKSELACVISKRGFTYKACPQLCKAALRKLRIMVVQVFARHEFQNGVAEEFEPLVTALMPEIMLIGIRAVTKCQLQPADVRKGTADFLLQFRQFFFHIFSSSLCMCTEMLFRLLITVADKGNSQKSCDR